jgi:segregation and condensation protein B
VNQDNEPLDSPADDHDQAAASTLTAAQVSGAVEAMLIMATEPISAATLAEALQVPVDVIASTLIALQEDYHADHRGFELRHVGGGWRYWTRPEYSDIIGRWILEGQHGRLSQAALETLSVIAYLQPISRARVSAVRGVNVDGVVRTLLARDLIQEEGADERTGAATLRTTAHFLERLGLESLDELPELAPYLPEASEVEAELEFARAAQPTDRADDDRPSAEHESPATPSETVESVSHE